MCERYSFWILRDGGILGDPGAGDQSHEGFANDAIKAMCADNAYREMACRVEYVPDWNVGPLAFDSYTFTVDEPIRPAWWTEDAEQAAIEAMRAAIVVSIPTSGHHTVKVGEFLCVAGDAVIDSVTGGDAWAYDNATIQSVTGGVAYAYSNATIASMTGGYARASGNATIQSVTGGEAYAYDNATIVEDERGA